MFISLEELKILGLRVFVYSAIATLGVKAVKVACKQVKNVFSDSTAEQESCCVRLNKDDSL